MTTRTHQVHDTHHDDTELITVDDPSTGELVAQFRPTSAAGVEFAVSAAAAAFTTWRRTTPAQRGDALLALADDVSASAALLADVESREAGKPRASVLADEIPVIVDQLRFFAGAARRLDVPASGEYATDHTSSVYREPIGVCAQITPWNYPLMMAVWKLAPTA